jgi:hypothetical protein
MIRASLLDLRSSVMRSEVSQVVLFAAQRLGGTLLPARAPAETVVLQRVTTRQRTEWCVAMQELLPSTVTQLSRRCA